MALIKPIHLCNRDSVLKVIFFMVFKVERDIKREKQVLRAFNVEIVKRALLFFEEFGSS